MNTAITLNLSDSVSDLEGILELQKQNLKAGLSAKEITEQGFVTVAHTLDDLERMHHYEKNIVAKDGAKVVAYVLGMTQASQNDIPRLQEMFDSFNHVQYKGKSVSASNYVVVGQVCVDKNYRGQGLFQQIYQAYKNHFSKRYDFAITEVASINLRSMNAHKRVGFETIHTYVDESGIEWNLVVWDWSQA
ncbi:GNAT family N-acetyltransferase [Pedobacter sp. MW01-1-1]|uniref:GNAT family N-acetyltransferase n=1 Tax=Pedobacter sp. MW01-1-1 TaxID=3383027 RepID=UPI003FF153F8